MNRAGGMGGWQRDVAGLRHDLAAHPAFDTRAVVELAEATALEQVEAHRADLPVIHPSGEVRRLKSGISDLLEGDPGSPWWVMIGGLADHFLYGTIGSNAAAPFEQPSCAAEGRRATRLVSIFVSSAASVVPAHLDEQHNVLLQIRGTKSVVVAPLQGNDGLDAVIEGCVVTGVRNLQSLPAKTETYRLGPGDGLYLPPCTPHWVLGESDISVSLSHAWATPWSERDHLIRAWNARVRRLGGHPRSPRPGHPVDVVKAKCVRARERVRTAIGV